MQFGVIIGCGITGTQGSKSAIASELIPNARGSAAGGATEGKAAIDGGTGGATADRRIACEWSCIGASIIGRSSEHRDGRGSHNATNGISDRVRTYTSSSRAEGITGNTRHSKLRWHRQRSEEQRN